VSDGFVYFIEASESGFLKIGWAKDPVKRLRELQTGCPYELTILGQCPGSLEDEAAFHRTYADLRVRGEWFRLDGALRERFAGAAQLNLLIERDLARVDRNVKEGVYIARQFKRKFNYAIRQFRNSFQSVDCWDEEAWKVACEEWVVFAKLWSEGKPERLFDFEDRVTRRVRDLKFGKALPA